MIWDVTCADTLAPSYLAKTSVKPGSAAALASNRKHRLYKKMKEQNYILIAVAFETLGPWGEETMKLLTKVGKEMVKITGDPRCINFLKQRFSLAIQRGNAASILGSFPKSSELEDIYLL